MINNARMVFLVALLASAAAVTAQTKGKHAPVPEFITKGIEELSTEMEAYVKDPAAATRREKADYFAQSTETIEEATLIQLLEKRHNRNPAIDAYVKWQLLSLQKTPFTEAHTKDAVAIYRKAYQPPSRPGTGNDGEMVTMLRGVTQNNLAEANAAWSAKQTAHTNIYTPIFSYRDELYSRLPKTFEVIRAGFEDADQRMQRGYDSRRLVDRLCTDLTAVAAGSKPNDIKNMVALTQFYAPREGLTAYESVMWDEKAKVIKWKTVKPNYNKKRMDQLSQDLVSMAQTGF